jgi:hypothetical protein
MDWLKKKRRKIRHVLQEEMETAAWIAICTRK